MRGSTAMIEKERGSELIRKFVVSQEMPDDEIASLSLDELTYIYFNTEIAKKDERYKAIHFPIKQQILYWGVVDAIKKAETLYVAFTEKPRYPYLDPGRNVWLFSTEENLTRALNKLSEDRGLHLIYQKLPNKVIIPFFAQLYYWGIEQVIIDNMNHPMIVKRSDVMPEMDQKKDEKKQQDLCNGKLQAALIQHAQFMAQNPDASVFKEDKEKLKVYTILANNVFFEVCDAKFMAPTVMEKDGKTYRAGEEIPEGARPAIVFLGKKDSDQKALPLFTDITEFMRVYKPHEMGISIVTYEAAEKMAKANNAEIVINRNGTGLTVNEHVMGLIDKIRAKKEEVKEKVAEQAEEGNEAPKSEPTVSIPKTVMPTEAKPKTESAPEEPQGEVTYGDLVEEPDMLMGALKRTAKATRQVKRMWLAQRMQGNKEGYLLVAETTSSSDTVLEQLKLAAKDYLNGKEIECRRADPTALAIVDNIKPFYKKGIFG